MRRPKPHEKKSIIREALERTKTVNDLETDDCLVISLKHLDREQGDNLHNWDSKNILARAVETLAGYCHSSLRSQATTKKFTIYPGFPPKEKTNFFHPKHVPEDAEWARIHVTGEQCVVGHVVKNTFYIVFLDPLHGFYISELKNT